MSDFKEFLSRIRGKSLLLDTNLLLLLVAGHADRRLVKTWPRVRNLGHDSYDVLNKAVDNFVQFFDARIVTTPNILTEVSNLGNDLKYDHRNRFFDAFAELIAVLFEESYVTSSSISGSQGFAIFGLTDMAILDRGLGEPCLVLTEDGTLADFLARKGVDTMTLDEIRARS